MLFSADCFFFPTQHYVEKFPYALVCGVAHLFCLLKEHSLFVFFY